MQSTIDVQEVVCLSTEAVGVTGPSVPASNTDTTGGTAWPVPTCSPLGLNGAMVGVAPAGADVTEPSPREGRFA